MLNNDVAVVACGQAGGNIGLLFEQKGYETIYVNSSSQDMATLKGAKKLRQLKGLEGCAGDTERARKGLANNMDIVDEIIGLKESIICLTFSTSGGTGSGVAPVLAEILCEETDKTVFCIAILPDESEDYEFHVNSYKCCQQLQKIEGLGSCIFVDNNKMNKLKINEIITTMIHSFLTNNAVSEKGNVDVMEKRTMIACPGAMTINVIGADKVTDEKILEVLTTNNIYAPAQSDGKVDYVAVINSNRCVNRNTLQTVYGSPKRTFVGYDSTQTIIAAAGLSFPLDHIIHIRDIAKNKHDARISSIKATNIVLDDLVLNEPKVKIEEKPKKKLSRREMLLQM